MRQIELTQDPQQVLTQALNARLAAVWTTVPGIVQSFDPAHQTAQVKPAIRALKFDQDGNSTPVELPLLVDCPVIFPSGGGYTLTFPMALGDECLILFSARCIDAWWQSGGVQNQAVMRLHDLSDGFVLAGISSVPNVIPAISTAATQLRSKDGQTYVEVGPSEIKVVAATVNVQATNATVTASNTASVDAPTVDVNASSAANITTPTATVTGSLVVTGNVTIGGTLTI